MFDYRSPAEWKRVWRYYQAGIVNTLFGYGLFAGLITLGLNLYAAQIIAHVLGVAFNYLTYSRYTFAGHSSNSSKRWFILSYVVNYFLALGALALAIRVVDSPYVAGLGATIVVSLINYFILKRFVFGGSAA
jgi:putative flippase GtrA